MAKVVRPEGVEPPTYWFEASCSIQLSYGRTLHLLQLGKNTGTDVSRQLYFCTAGVVAGSAGV